MARTSDALKILEKMNQGDSELQGMIREASLNAEVAQLIYDDASNLISSRINSTATCGSGWY